MILVYTSNITPRVRYIFNFILNDILNIDIKLTSDRKKFEESENIRINYSDLNIDRAYKIKPHTLLFEPGIINQQIEVSEWKGTKMFFQTDTELTIPFDLFAASFFLLTRYEEYLSTQKDKHGRFPAEESLAYMKDFLEEPLIDQWAFLLAGTLKDYYPAIKFPGRKYKYIPTIDVDIAYAYKYKGLVRSTGAIAKDMLQLKLKENLFRIKVLLGLAGDPYDTYEYLERLHLENSSNPVFFFLVGKYGKFDKNHSIRNYEYRTLIRGIAEKFEVGIHPSYASNNDFHAMQHEIENFSQLLGKRIEKSRQHFLKLSIPETYRKLIKLGIAEDYTMGYASKPGFRASTCTPFFFYDLENEEQTSLRIFSFQAMDATLNQYSQLNQEEAVGRIQKLVNAVKKVNGTFITLWHNESLGEQNDWKAWSVVYEKVLKICKSE
jgi:hypothetical protein